MEKISIKITDMLLKKHYINESMYDIYQYGMQMILEIGNSFIVSVIICCLCEMLIEGLIFFAVFIPLRSYLGGFHMKSYWACFICSCITLLGILVLIRVFNPNIIIIWSVLLASTIVILWEAHNEKIADEEGEHYYPKICIITSSVLILSIFCSILGNFTIVFLLACTNTLTAVCKILEKKV